MISSCSKNSKHPYPKPLNDYQCHWTSSNKDAFPCSTCLKLFLGRSSLFYLVMTCSASFHFLQATTSQNVFTSKFAINQLHVDFITKDCKRHYKVGQLKVEYVLQIGTGITKRNNFYFKVGQYLQSNAVQKTNGRKGESNRFWELAILFTQHFPLGIFEKLKICYN